MKRRKRNVLLMGSLLFGIAGYGCSSFILWYCSGCLFVLFGIAFAIDQHALSSYRMERMVQSDHENTYVDTDAPYQLVHNKQIGFALSIERPQRCVIPLPWLTVKESWLHVQTGRKISFHWVFTPWWSRTIHINYQFMDLERGQYIAQDMELITSDGFGFIEKRQTFPLLFQFDVLPTKMDDSPSTGAKMAPFGIQGTVCFPSLNVADGLRDYQVGEPLSQIDWKSSARHRKWLSKMSESQQLPNYVIVLDEQLDHTPPVDSAIHNGDLSDDRMVTIRLDHAEDQHVVVAVPPLFPQYERRIGLSFHLWESLRYAGQQVEWIGSQMNQHMASCSDLRGASLLRISARLRGAYDSSGQLFARCIREESRNITAYMSLICVTSQISPQVLQALAEVRSKHVVVHVYFVHSSSQLSHAQREAQKMLHAMGCHILVVPHERSMWPSGSRVLETTRGHHTAMRLVVTPDNRQAHVHRSQTARVNDGQLRGGAEIASTYSS